MITTSPIAVKLKYYETNNTLAQEDEAISIILKSGVKLTRMSVFEVDEREAIVRLHNLAEQGRHMFVVSDEIAVMFGGLDG